MAPEYQTKLYINNEVIRETLPGVVEVSSNPNDAIVHRSEV